MSWDWTRSLRKRWALAGRHTGGVEIEFRIQHSTIIKGKGELGEIGFLHKAASLGSGVAKPYGEKEAYDFILDSGKRLWRVQVKSIYSPFGVGYRTMGRHSNNDIYKAEEIDFLVAYTAFREIWYAIPVNHIAASRVLTFYPSGCKQGGHFECWREAWHLMAPGPDATPQPKILRRVHAMACERISSVGAL